MLQAWIPPFPPSCSPQGVWLLARCVDLLAMGYSVRHFWLCVRVLLGLGLVQRIAACTAMFIVNRDKQH
jgi:hypothetical protein